MFRCLKNLYSGNKTLHLNRDIFLERETIEELEALTTLCNQLEKWREETESDLTVSQRMSDKMRAEKKTLADEKRQLVLTLILFILFNPTVVFIQAHLLLV